jgi:CDP-glycerol glycerophosphotransferase
MVLTGSREHYEAAARARFIVGNSLQQPWFAKREGQFYVQCWHGTALKKIGYDVETMPFERAAELESLRHEVPQWDLLVSPSPYMTSLMRRAFRYEGEIIESGYPRNDLLLSPAGGQIAADVRSKLGIPSGKRPILYAPTWRDDVRFAPGRNTARLELHLERARESLGDDHVLLLRTHWLLTDRPRIPDDGFVIDVSTYPEIADLYLASDALITDYSAAAVDFAVTGKPMLFFAPDLEQYRDRVRGLYFDLEAAAPGPVLSTSDEVIEAVTAIDGVSADYAAAYKAFTDSYCPHDDGKATARLVERIFT